MRIQRDKRGGGDKDGIGKFGVLIGERREEETTAQRESEKRFGLERGGGGGERSQGRKFDDDHDNDG